MSANQVSANQVDFTARWLHHQFRAGDFHTTHVRHKQSLRVQDQSSPALQPEVIGRNSDSSASVAAPIIPASLPSVAGTISRLSQNVFSVRSRIVLLILPISRSPALATPPPITIRCGFSNQTTLDSPTPSLRPMSDQSASTNGSPASAAADNLYGTASSSERVLPAEL